MIHEKVGSLKELVEVIEILDKNENIECILMKEENSCYHECLNICLNNTTTEYLTIVKISDVFFPEYSSKHIEYLDSNPNCDIAFSSFTINNEKEENIFYGKSEQIFIDDFDNKNLPTNGFVWRKKMHSIVYYFESSINVSLESFFHAFLKKCLRSHLNICCVSDEILFMSCSKW